jgi:hypothetical protein
MKISSRHEAAVEAVCWAMREAAGGLYPAQRAAQRLADAFIKAMAEPTQGSDRVLAEAEAASEFDGILAWAIGQVADEDPEQVRRSALGRTQSRRLPRLGPVWRLSPEPANAQDSEAEGARGGDAPGDAHGENLRSEPQSSWEPINLKAVLAGDLSPEEPTMLARSDGAGMIYPGRAHIFYGEKESLKTWAAEIACAQLLVAGVEVLYVDFEDNEKTLVARLMALGVTGEQILDGLTYIRPDEPLDDAQAEKMNRLTAEHDFRLAILDGVTEAMVLHDMDINDNADSAAFQRLLARELTSRGIAVVSIDHTSPTSPRREDKPIGAQHKQTGIDGAAFYFDAKTPLARALEGTAVTGITRIQVTKDRPGGVRGRSEAQKTFGELVMTAQPDGRIDYEIRPITPGEGTEPTWYMERVSLFLEKNPDATARDIRSAVTGKNKWIDAAVRVLIEKEYVRRIPQGSAFLHHVVTPYREPTPFAENKDPYANDDDGLTAHGGVE